MKKILLCLLIAMAVTRGLQAQSSYAIPYQAVARDAVGNLIANKNVSIQISILDASQKGTVLYKEKFNTATNQFGLFTVAIGTGTPLSGTYKSIAWEINSKFLKVEFDPKGGNSFIDMGTTQMMSV
ncbi:MAG: hypothetical protein WKF91_13905, partial [Segetibacter sp.]